MLLIDGNVLLHVVGRAQHHGDPLVDVGGLDVQNVAGPRGGHAARLLHDERHGVALVQQPQLTDGYNAGGWSVVIDKKAEKRKLKFLISLQHSSKMRRDDSLIGLLCLAAAIG